MEAECLSPLGFTRVTESFVVDRQRLGGIQQQNVNGRYTDSF